MAEAGILGEDDRVELIDGEIVEMTPIGHRHAACVKRLAEVFLRTFGGHRTARVVRRGEQIAPSVFPDRAIAVADVLPE